MAMCVTAGAQLLKLLRQLMATVLAVGGRNRHHSLHLGRRKQLAMMARMPLLSGGLTLAAGTTASRRSGLAQAIERRRLGGVAGVLLVGRQLPL